MKTLSSRVLSLVLPLVVAALATAVVLLIKKPLLTEVLVALLVFSAGYFLFVFVCLFFNLGIQKERPFEFSNIPGLTKQQGWFKNMPSLDTGGGLDLSGGDDALGCLAGALLVIFLPVILAVLVFLISGGIEFLVFLVAYVGYHSVVRILRMQLTSRRVAKGRWFASLGFALLHTATSVGLLPLGLWIYLMLRAA